MKDIKLDGFDRRILDIIQHQGDLGPSELSPLVHLSPSQCSRRLQRLKKENYIRGTVALLEPAKLNLTVSAYVAVKLRSHSHQYAENFRKRVLSLPEIVSCELLTGEDDMILKVATKDLDSFREFLQTKIHTASEIETARSSIIMESLKGTTILTLEFS